MKGEQSAESPTGESAHVGSGISKRRRILWRRLLFTVGFVAGILAVDYFCYPYGQFGGRSLNRGENGLWLRYSWYFGEKTDADLAVLADRLRRMQICYAYFHVRSITRDGSLKYRYRESGSRLTTRLRKLAPGVKLLAWIYAGSKKGEGEVDLTRSEVRARMVKEAVWLVESCGFDGIQWDYEICSENEPGFLELLRETRSVLPKGSILSVAAPVNMPWPLGRFGWSEDYFARVATHCDQICVMAYDSGMWLPRSYAWMVHRQAICVSRSTAVGDPGCRLLIGLPTYGKGFISHNPRAENIRIGLKGVRDGMADTSAVAKVFAGVALFADYTTDEAEWRTYSRLWLNQ